jgi:hypothetical protein
MSKVARSTGMDAETFYKHWNLRHMPLAGVKSFRACTEDSTATAALRAYHKRLHTIVGRQNHQHGG